MNRENEIILDVQNLKKYFPIRGGLITRTVGHVKAVDGISFKLRRGETLGIVGESGCGKSTLIKTAMGLIKPAEGKVFIGEWEAASLSHRKLASLIGYVGQEAGCVFDFSVWDVVSMAMYARSENRDRKRPAESKTAQTVVSEALDELGILHLKDRSILSLSGGERKMVFIARAIAQGAETLILDEPTNGLDPVGIHEIRTLIRSLPEQYDCTVLVSSHLLPEIELMADDIGILNHGHLLFEGSMEQLKAYAHENGYPTDNLEQTFLALVDEDNQQLLRKKIEKRGKRS